MEVRRFMAKNKVKVKDTNKKGLSIYLTLVLFALLPMILSIVVTLIINLSEASKELKQVTNNSMLGVIKDTGAGLDFSIEASENTVKAFAASPGLRRQFFTSGADANDLTTSSLFSK